MNRVHVHRLTGLKPEALATYLGALGVLRLVSGQKDRSARGYWADEHFVLVTSLDWDGLLKFFCEEYRPTPILAPWNQEGGFFSFSPEEAGDEASAKKGSAGGAGCMTNTEDEDTESNTEPEEGKSGGADIDPLLRQILNSKASRFEELKRAVEICLECMPSSLQQREREVRQAKGGARQRSASGSGNQGSNGARKELEEAKKKFREELARAKAQMVADLRKRLGEVAGQWVDAAVYLDEGEGMDLRFAPVFGTGGVDGRMEFTKHFRRHLGRLFDFETGQPRQETEGRLKATLLGTPAETLVEEPVGQFFPGRAGGANMGTGYEGRPAVNPWEFVLMLEGAVALVAGVTRRGETGRPRYASPFWVDASSAGYGSASASEEATSGEQWLPIWRAPLLYEELQELIREGRAQVGRSTATKATEMVRAAARLGLARGIEALQRFAYLERNGQSTLAISAGRFRVEARRFQTLLDEVAPWIDSLSVLAREKSAPRSLAALGKQVQDMVFSLCRREATPHDIKRLLVLLGRAELELARRYRSRGVRPLPRLSPGWVKAMDDGTEAGRAVIRLALSLAAQRRPPEDGEKKMQGSVRCHFLPLENPDAPEARFRTSESGSNGIDPEWVCMGRDLVSDALAVLRRRSIWSRWLAGQRGGVPRLPLWGPRGCEATLEEVGWWLWNPQHDRLILDLARPMAAINWAGLTPSDAIPASMRSGTVEPLQSLFRLAYLPFDVPIGSGEGGVAARVAVRFDPEPLRRLAGGDLEGALETTVHRLTASGLRPVLRRGIRMPVLARRIAASLVFPISEYDAARAAALVCKPYEGKGEQG